MVAQIGFFNLGMTTGLGEGKFWIKNLQKIEIVSTLFHPQEQFKTASINFSVYTMRYIKILHTYSLISHTLFQNILFNTTVWPPTKPQKFATPF